MSEDLDLARALLAEAKKRRADAEQQVEQARAAVDRASAIVADCRETLNRFDDLNREVAAAHGEAIRNWARVGGDRPSLSMPVSLSARHEAKLKAEQEMTAATAALDALKAEMTTAQELVQSRHRMVQDAACAVMAQEAEAMADELDQALTTVFDLRPKLLGLAGFWTPHRNAAFRISQRVLSLCIGRNRRQ